MNVELLFIIRDEVRRHIKKKKNSMVTIICGNKASVSLHFALVILGSKVKCRT